MQKTNARASETSEQTLNRRETDQVRKTRKRASETSEQTLNRMLVVVVFTLRYIIMQRSYVCANVVNVRGYRRYVDMYTSAYQRHSPTVGLHAEGLALQCLSLLEGDNFVFSLWRGGSLTQLSVWSFLVW